MSGSVSPYFGVSIPGITPLDMIRFDNSLELKKLLFQVLFNFCYVVIQRLSLICLHRTPRLQSFIVSFESSLLQFVGHRGCRFEAGSKPGWGLAKLKRKCYLYGDICKRLAFQDPVSPSVMLTGGGRWG